ncbi:rhodanese-like domain-containing protein [Algibacter sp.]|uniref:rhodanese-like domain-containing protein n=1 Tax=Algibacter sp. TaxID=1872428 RepID=UPI003C73E7A8
MKSFQLLVASVLFSLMVSCQSSDNKNGVRISPEIFNDSISNNETQIIDVRTPKEFKLYHIEGAENINYYSEKFADSVRLLNPKKAVFLYCRSGKRSSESVTVFKELGFKNIYDLEGGIINWTKEGYKVISN